MMNLTVTPERLGVEIRELTRQAKAMTLYYGVEIGRRLMAAKELVPYGSWGGWLRDNTEFSQATATRFMRLFDEYGASQIGLFGAEVKSSTLQNLSISNALRLLAVPEEEREEFAEAVDAENISARELEKAIKERDEAKKAAEDAREAAERTQKVLDETENDLKNARADLHFVRQEKEALEKRGPETVYQRDEEAIKAAAQKEKDKAAKELKKKTEEWTRQTEEAKKETEALRKKLVEAQAQAAAASGEAEKKRLEEEIDSLRKKLAMADKEITAAGLYFSQWQQTYNQMTQAVSRIEDADKAAKLKAAVKAQLGAWMKTMEG